MSDKKEKARQRRITTARDLEGRGHVEHAVKEYLRAKVPGEAARLLAKHGRLEDAGRAILDGLKVTIDDVGELSENDRVLVEQAVLFFEHGHAGAMAEKLEAALAAAPPPDPGARDRALPTGPVEPAETKRPARGSEPPSGPPAQRNEPPSGPPAQRNEPPSGPPAQRNEPPRPATRPVKKLSDADTYVPPEKPRPSLRSAATSGSFRSPSQAVTSSGGFRAPTTSGSFRAPAPSSSFRAPARPMVDSSEPSTSSVEQPARSSSRAAIAGKGHQPPSREPSETVPHRSPISTGSFVRPASREPSDVAPSRPVIRAESFAPVKRDSVPAEAHRTSSTPPRRSTPPPEEEPAAPPRDGPSRPAIRPPRPSTTQLSASGEVITEHAGSREQGWRGAGTEALDKAIEEHLAAGRKGAAARIAREAGQHDRALVWFEELGLHHQAGACLRAIGRYDEALVMLMKQDISGANYRKACFELVAVAKELGTTLDFTYDRFLTRFIEQGPTDRDEISTYLDLAHLYLANEFASGAKRCLRKILASDPAHIEARELDAQLRRAARRSSAEAPRAATLPASARGLPPLPSLEEFVELARAHAPEE